MGDSSHDHTITITAVEFADLATGTVLLKPTSDSGGHTHDIVVTCADV